MKNRITSVISHKKIIIPIAIILVVLIIFGVTRPSAVSQVQTEKITYQDLTQSLSASGSIDSTQSVNLSFGSAGKLVYLGVKKGDTVKAGQTIATLDQRIMQKNLEASLRTYSEQRNTFEQTKEDKGVQNIRDAMNDKLKRILENNQFDLEKAVISVELQSLAKEQSVLTTPIAGIVTRADVTSTGVNVGLTTTFSVASPKDLVFSMDIDESDIGKIKEGMPVKLVLSAFPDKTLYLSIDAIDFATHTTTTGGNVYTIQAKLPDNTDDYRLGMTGDADIILQKKSHVITVPVSSLVDDTYTYVKTKNTFEKRKLTLGFSNDTDAEVLHGLSEGDLVAVDPTQAEKVKPKQFLFF